MIAIKDTLPHMISFFYTLLANVVCINLFCTHSTRLLLNFNAITFNFNAITFTSATHVFDKAWTNLIYHDSTIVQYHYHNCRPQSQ